MNTKLTVNKSTDAKLILNDGMVYADHVIRLLGCSVIGEFEVLETGITLQVEDFDFENDRLRLFSEELATLCQYKRESNLKLPCLIDDYIKWHSLYLPDVELSGDFYSPVDKGDKGKPVVCREDSTVIRHPTKNKVLYECIAYIIRDLLAGNEPVARHQVYEKLCRCTGILDVSTDGAIIWENEKGEPSKNPKNGVLKMIDNVLTNYYTVDLG
ncbi:MAG: hypothetical protein V7745_02870 [Pseudomonadales bacterium]